MMLRIDLLRPRERRYQGPVSRRFLVHTGVATAVAVLLLAVGQRAFLAFTLSRSIRSARAAQETLQPFYTRLLKMQSISSGTQRYVNELAGWSRSRLEWNRLMTDLARHVPASIQLLRLDIRDELSVPPLAPPAAGAAPRPPDPVRTLQVRLSGRAQGDMAEDAVGRLIQNLKPARGASNSVYRTVTLLSMQRDHRGDVAQSTFEIEITGAERTLQ